MIILETSVPVECHVIHAEMDVLSDVPYIVPVLEHLRERGGGATAESLSAEMFMIEPLCSSLLRFCIDSMLAKEDGGGATRSREVGSSRSRVAGCLPEQRACGRCTSRSTWRCRTERAW